MPSIFIRRYCVILLLFISISVFGQPEVENGSIDLRSHILDGEAISLAGSWDFYWSKLLEPHEIDFHASTDIQVPGSWHRQGDYNPLGFATYRLRMQLPPQHRGLTIYLPIVNASACVYMNGRVAAQSGLVSSDAGKYEPKLGSTLVPLPDGAEQVDVLIQVANYSYFSGGIAGTPILNFSSEIFTAQNRRNGVENFFAGSLVAMCIYQLILYFLYHRGKPYLWLALICLGVALRSLIVHGGSFLLPDIFPGVAWEFWKKLEFGSVYAIVALFPLYVYHLFQPVAPRRPIYIFSGVAIFLCIAVIVSPQYMYGQLLEICHVALLLGFVYAIFSIHRAWRAGSSDARVILFGVLASFPFILAEILKNSRFFPVDISFMYMVELGVLVFLLFQVYLLANHYAKSYQHLEHMNQNLERMVEERSGELVKANAVKEKLLSVMSHDIKSPLNSLKGMLQILNQGAIDQDDFRSYTRYIESDLNNTSMMVENVLYWTASQMKGIHAKVEPFDLKTAVEENIRLVRTIATNKNLVVHHNLSEATEILADKNILNLVLRNLISNAIKFSFEGGEINIATSMKGGSLIIEVCDQGVGMSVEKRDDLFASRTTVSATGTMNEKGTGLGLALCREYLKEAGGDLQVESTPDKGSVFRVTIPLGSRLASK